MSVQLLKRVTCDLCGRTGPLEKLEDYYDRSLPPGWVRLSYDLDDHNESNIQSGKFDICECCLAREDCRIEFYPSKMTREIK